MLKAVTYFASRIFCIATLTERMSRDPCVYETATTAAGQKQHTLSGIKPKNRPIPRKNLIAGRHSVSPEHGTDRINPPMDNFVSAGNIIFSTGDSLMSTCTSKIYTFTLVILFPCLRFGGSFSFAGFRSRFFPGCGDSFY